MTEQEGLTLINEKLKQAEGLLRDAMEIANEAKVRIEFTIPEAWTGLRYYPTTYSDLDEYDIDDHPNRIKALDEFYRGQWLSSTDECNLY